MAKTKYPPFALQTLEALAAILGRTDGGLTNKEIESAFSALGIRDPVRVAQSRDPLVQQGLMYVAMSKRDRILRALQADQERTNTGNAAIAFLAAVMKPQRYVGSPTIFEDRRGALNEALAFEGIRVLDDGRVARSDRAATLSDAARIAGRLHTELSRRDTHKDVLAYCTEEVLVRNLFHAALEAVKGVGDRLRRMTGIDADGAELVQQVLACKSRVPPLRINALQSESERNEQVGFMNIVIGLFGMYRNPIAHDPRVVRQVERPITEVELLELFTTLSMVHRRLDGAVSASDA